MGLSIHYSGSFNAKASLTAMIEEVKDIAETFEWKYYVFEDTFPAGSSAKNEYNQNIYGICLTPPGCETVWLCFLSNGRMSSPLHLQLYGNSINKDAAEHLFVLSTKTQFAGIEIHKLIIHLLKYLDRKYLQDLTVTDEGYYWETGDEKLLQETFKRHVALTEIFTSSLENYPRQSGESFEAYFERLAKEVNERYKK